MKDASGRVLYIGKAKDLRGRVSAYFGREEKERYQVKFLMEKVASIEFETTKTEKEAILLEHKLIQKHKPRYNVAQKDDKTFVRLKLSVQHPYPALYVTRRVKKDNAAYFGPYVAGQKAREMADHAVKFFRLRTCSDIEFANRARPCIQYDIGRCTAPCVSYVSKEEYAVQVAEAVLFLKGVSRELLKHLKQKMSKASVKMEYEDARYYRDLIKGIKGLLERQRVVRPDEELTRGDQKTMLAEEELYMVIARKLSSKLRLKGDPMTIECVDVSNIQGTSASGAIVSFIAGRAAKNRYRLFNLFLEGKQDDYFMMKEVISRRFRHKDWDPPDLLLVDGGKGQLNIAVNVIQELGITGLEVAAVAKVEGSHRKGTDSAQVFLPNRVNPIKFRKGDEALLYLIRIRDEAHRFVIGHYRRRHAKKTFFA